MNHCVWKKQPETHEELEQAFAAFDACCLGCYRYAGNDPTIIERLGPEYCDQAARRSSISRFKRTMGQFVSVFRRP